jgi:hypothetical protein
MAARSSRIGAQPGAAVCVIAATAILLLAACTQAVGPAVDQSRTHDAFSRIEAGGGVQVTVTFGAAQPVVVHAAANLQEKVHTSVRDGVLKVEVDALVVGDSAVIEVVLPALESVSLSGGARIDVRNLDAEAIEVSMSDGARATVSGSARAVTLDATSGAVASFTNLDAQTVDVALGGGAKADVRASATVTGSATGGAQLYISGGASVRVNADGGATVTSA